LKANRQNTTNFANQKQKQETNTSTISSLVVWTNRCGAESSTLETDVYVRCDVLLVVHARKEEEEETEEEEELLDIDSPTFLAACSCFCRPSWASWVLDLYSINCTQTHTSSAVGLTDHRDHLITVQAIDVRKDAVIRLIRSQFELTTDNRKIGVAMSGAKNQMGLSSVM